MSSNVIPSIPGDPFLAFTNLYASINVSFLHTWVYIPQNLHCGSAFALADIFSLNSCNVIGVFLIFTFASSLVRILHAVGLLCSGDITLLLCSYEPIRHLLIFRSISLFGYMTYLFQEISLRDEEGFSSCSKMSLYPCHRYYSAGRYISFQPVFKIYLLPSS